MIDTDLSFAVATGDGILVLEEIQPAGKRKMTSEEFLRGYTIQVGDQLGLSE